MLVQPWRIEMLGRLHVSRGEQTLTRFRTHKDAALLAYLAYYTEKPHVRDELLDILWPNDDLAAVRNRMRVGLNALRHQLEPPGTPAGAVLEAGRLTLRLRSGAFTSDVEEFKRAIEAAQQAQDEADRTRALVAAAAAYAGDLLPDFFEEWVLSEREPLAQSFRQSLHQLTRLMAQTKDYEAALAYARRAAQSDPMREEAHRDVMRLCVAIGQPSAALQQFETLKRLLEDGFGAAPSTTTQQLARQIEDNVGRPMVVSARPNIQLAVEPKPQPADPPREAATPPQRALPDSQQRRLPVYLTRFFGREDELAFLTELLSDSPLASSTAIQNRLITLTGPGGTGKTRLAMAVAERQREGFSGRVWFVALADLADPRLIADAMASALQLPRTPHRDGIQQVIEALASQPALVVLDNFEHLTDGGPTLVEELLAHLPLLTCLVTSRRSLGVPGEREVPIAPLPIPDEELGARRWALGVEERGIGGRRSEESVCLFVDRAQAVRPEFQLTERNSADVAALCRELEGIPLAIELAAAQVRMLTPAQMRTHLSRRFDLLVNRRADKDLRHRSMYAVIQSSFHLLSPPLRRLFAQLSVFRGGWTLEAAEAVCAADEGRVDSLLLPLSTSLFPDLERLCMDSLIVAEESGGEMRFRMLETLREFAAEQLSAEERVAVARRHITYCVNFAEEASRHLKRADEAVWLGCLERELDNFRAAFDASRLDPEGGEVGMRLTSALHRFWISRGPLREGRQRVATVLEHPGAQATTRYRADALYTAGGLALAQDDYDCARALTEQALEIAQALGYIRGVAHALSNLASIAHYQTDLDRAEELQRQSLALQRELDNEDGVAVALHGLALIAQQRYDYPAARALYAESLTLYTQLGNRLGMAFTHGNLGNIASRQNETKEARANYEQSLTLLRELGHKVGIASALVQMATILGTQHDFEGARAYYTEALSLFREQGSRRGLAAALNNLGDLESYLGHLEEARNLQEQSLAVYRELDDRDGVINALLYLGKTLIRLDDIPRGLALLEECLRLAQQGRNQLFVVAALNELAALADTQREWERAARYYGTAEAQYELLGCPLLPEQREELDALYDRLRAELTDARFSEAFASGRETPIEDLIAATD